MAECHETSHCPLIGGDENPLVILAELRAGQKSMESSINRLTTSIEGNGKPGLKQELQTVTMRVQRIEDTGRLAKYGWGVLVTVCGGIAWLVSHLSVIRGTK